jgi:prepilin-type N-terminal cleavage/methylation domain-containing protein/prepilin-type processing-associated H-X9-DG protein
MLSRLDFEERGQSMAASHPQTRRGFTLIELLVVIAIIAILIALLVPAVQRVREAAARSVCENNMHQIVIAAHAYHGDYKTFPPNTQDEGGWDWSYQQNARSWSWLARLLPYLEQQPLYMQAKIPTNTFGQSLPYLATGLEVFFCPSDDSQSLSPSTNRANLQGVPISTSNYKGVTGDCWCWGTYTNKCTGTCNGLNTGNGIFNRDTLLKLSQITDGTSSTFFMGEDVPEIDAHCAWPYANGSVGTCAIPPNVMARPGGGLYDPYNDWPEIYSFRSRHSGNGLNFCMVDGSVRWVSQGITQATYRALATISSNDIVGDF